jgi:predicted RNA-binding protein with PIN domain
MILCDGTKPRDIRDRRGAIGVHYAGGGVSADAAIERLVNESSHPRRLTVVSNDRAVQKAARRRGATVLRADTFLAQLAHDVQRAPRGRKAVLRRDPGPLSARQVDAWLRYFGIEP